MPQSSNRQSLNESSIINRQSSMDAAGDRASRLERARRARIDDVDAAVQRVDVRWGFQKRGWK
jgi:hypothetical protein